MNHSEKKISLEDYDAYFELALSSTTDDSVNGALEERSSLETKERIPTLE